MLRNVIRLKLTLITMLQRNTMTMTAVGTYINMRRTRHVQSSTFWGSYSADVVEGQLLRHRLHQHGLSALNHWIKRTWLDAISKHCECGAESWWRLTWNHISQHYGTVPAARTGRTTTTCLRSGWVPRRSREGWSGPAAPDVSLTTSCTGRSESDPVRWGCRDGRGLWTFQHCVF